MTTILLILNSYDLVQNHIRRIWQSQRGPPRKPALPPLVLAPGVPLTRAPLCHLYFP